MANDIVLNAGSGGSTLAADDISSVWYQRVKLVDGTEDSTTPINVGNGVAANALRVTVASDSTGVLSIDDNGGSITVDNADITSIKTAVEIIDNAVSGAGFNITQLGGVNVNMGEGIIATGTQRVTLATDDDGVAHLATIAGDTTSLDGKVVVGAGTEAAAVRVTLPTDGTGVVKLGAGTAGIGKLTANSGVDIGDVDVTSISAGANLIGDVGISGARTSGGTTLYKNIDVDESEDQVKGTAGQVYWITAFNLSASVVYLKLYNATAATVVVGTTVPDLTFPIPTQGDTNGAGFVLSIPNGIAFGTAITVACTTGIADADSGAPGANACVVNLGYA